MQTIMLLLRLMMCCLMSRLLIGLKYLKYIIKYQISNQVLNSFILYPFGWVWLCSAPHIVQNGISLYHRFKSEVNKLYKGFYIYYSTHNLYNSVFWVLVLAIFRKFFLLILLLMLLKLIDLVAMFNTELFAFNLDRSYTIKSKLAIFL